MLVVNVTREAPFRPENLIDNVTQLVIDIIRRNSEEDLAQADAIVDPGLALESYMSFDKARAFVRKGYEATRAPAGDPARASRARRSPAPARRPQRRPLPQPWLAPAVAARPRRRGAYGAAL